MRVFRSALAWAWAFLLAVAFAAEWCSRGASAPVRMFAIIVPVFLGMKVVVTAAERGRGPAALGFGPWCAFAFGWAGMRPGIFRALGNPPLEHARELLLSGLVRVAAGAALVWGARQAARLPLDRTASILTVSILLLTGYSLILHFGLLRMSAGFWRGFGVEADLLFRNPFASGSLREFWSRRWNIAFSEMTALTVYRPSRRMFGARAGLLASFLFSGILHELAISVPVMTGFGKPLLYFLIQGVAVLGEAGLASMAWPAAGKAVVSRLWTFFWILAPVPLLFHPGFLAGIVWPLAGLAYPD